MSTNFYALNQVYRANIYPSDENIQFPTENIKDYRRTKVFRTISDSGSIVFDFGEAIEIDSFVIVDAKHRPFNIQNVVFEINGSNAWGSPLFSEAVDLDYDFGVGHKNLESPIFARYARITFDSIEDFCEISKVFIGKRTVTQGEPTYPIQYSPKNLATITINRLGQKFVDEVATQNVLGLSFQTLDKDEIDGIFEMADFCSTTIPLFIIVDCENIANNTNRLSGYFYFSEDIGGEFIVGNFWNTSISLEEGM